MAAPPPPFHRKSINITECVAVPSSEHVAEIVGRQGCRIKALRARTRTYIRTPLRGEQPVFVLTGRQHDVASARSEILGAAQHFSLIRATRTGTGTGTGTGIGAVLPLPGHTTVQVRVPYRVVGLVVGRKGATIKRIQQQTRTFIVTPGRHQEPVFAVTGLPEDVARARQEIAAHIALRTGTGAVPQPGHGGTDVGRESPAWPGPAQARGYRHSSASSLGSASTDSARPPDRSPSSPLGAAGFWFGEFGAFGEFGEFGELLPAEEPPLDSPLAPRLSPPVCDSPEPPRGRARPPALPTGTGTGTGSCSSSNGGSAASSPPESRRGLCLESGAGRLCPQPSPACPVCRAGQSRAGQSRS